MIFTDNNILPASIKCRPGKAYCSRTQAPSLPRSKNEGMNHQYRLLAIWLKRQKDRQLYQRFVIGSLPRQHPLRSANSAAPPAAPGTRDSATYLLLPRSVRVLNVTNWVTRTARLHTQVAQIPFLFLCRVLSGILTLLKGHSSSTVQPTAAALHVLTHPQLTSERPRAPGWSHQLWH